MQKHAELTRQRLQQFAGSRGMLAGSDGLRGLVYPRREAVALQVFAAPGRIPYAEAVQGAYRLAQLGEVFGPDWATHWFRIEIDVPAGWAGQEVQGRPKCQAADRARCTPTCSGAAAGSGAKLPDPAAAST